jgi:uncharacterized protein YukE
LQELPELKERTMKEIRADKYLEERERLGKMVRRLWVDWAKRQPNPKPSWLVGWDELPERDKEADRCIGEGMYIEFCSEQAGFNLFVRELKQLSEKLRDELHGYRECFDETDAAAGKLIDKFDSIKATFGEFF